MRDDGTGPTYFTLIANRAQLPTKYLNLAWNMDESQNNIYNLAVFSSNCCANTDSDMPMVTYF